MALRKKHSYTPTESKELLVHIDPFGYNQKDNGVVELETTSNTIFLTYNDIAELYGKVFPQQAYDCNGNKKDSWATLTQEERDKFNSVFPSEEGGFQEMAFDKREAY